MRLGILFLLTIVISGCASQTYRETQESKFTGALDVRWVKNDYFLFLPNKDHPFMLIRANGQSIRPGPMYTDGGSIPRFLWGIKGYSPWGMHLHTLSMTGSLRRTTAGISLTTNTPSAIPLLSLQKA